MIYPVCSVFLTRSGNIQLPNDDCLLWRRPYVENWYIVAWLIEDPNSSSKGAQK